MLGYLNLPKWRDYFLKKLIELNLRDMVSCPVMGMETAESPWQTLDSEEYFSCVNTSVSFFGDKQSKNFDGNLITTDDETAIYRLSVDKYQNTFFSGAIGGVSSFLKILCEPNQISKPAKFFVQNDGVASYILSALENGGKSLDEAINESQWEKIADSSPIKNIHGIVSRNRFILLLAEVFGIFLLPEEIDFCGFNNLDIADVHIAKNIGFSIRLLGIAEKTPDGCFKACVEPCLIPSAYMLAQARGGSEIIYVKNNDGLVQVYGCPGSSMDTRINGILQDYYNLKCVHNRKELQNSKQIILKDFENSFYIRLETADKTSDLALILNYFKEFGVKILSIKEPLKHDYKSKSPETIILITDLTTRSKISECISKAALNIPSVSFKSFYRYINR